MTTARPERDPEIQALLDERAIRNAILRFCRGVDRCDATLINSAFHSDAIDEHGGHGIYSGDIGARTIEFIRAKERFPVHMITNQLITVDGDTAGSETYFFTSHREMVGDEELVFQGVGRYIDRFERRNGEWKIVHRLIATESSHFLRPEPVPVRSRLGLGKMDATDPSYAVLEDVTEPPS